MSATEAVPAAPSRVDRAALVVVQGGALAVVLAALPYKMFDLDRHLVPKELALQLTAIAAATLCLAGARRLAMTRVDLFLAGWLALGLAGAVFAPNRWLAQRALAVSISGVALYMVAKALRRAGLSRALLATLALAVVVGALTALAQAYGVVSDLASLSRAPGGTFGNRNFVAHLGAIGTPVLLLLAIEARTARGHALATIGLALVAAAIVLSRTRAAWLALIACAALLAVGAWGLRRLWGDARRRRRALVAAGSVIAASAAALLLPNTLEWKSDSPYLDSVKGVVNYREGSGRGRLIQYANTARMAAAHPLLGVGAGNWPVEYRLFAKADDPSLDRDEGTTSNPWPSSDWMAFLSERGIPALLLLLLALAGIGVTATRGWGGARDRSEWEQLASLALVATLTVTVVVGMFDAVLLLATPTLFAWTLFGALAPDTTERWSLTPSHAVRRALVAGAVVLGLAVAVPSAMRIAAMSVFADGGSTRAQERAARLDPSSYRIRIRLAEAYARRGNCAKVRQHAGAARALLPNAPEPRRLLRRCS